MVWATTAFNAVVGADGKNREMFMLHLDSLPMWLATIEPSRVSASPLVNVDVHSVSLLSALVPSKKRGPELNDMK